MYPLKLKNLLLCAVVALTACTASAGKEEAAESDDVVVGAARTGI